MGKPVFLADNLFSTRIYPAHLLTAEEEAAGFPVERLANGRRSANDYWTPTTANSQTWAQSQTDRARASNCCVIDASNLPENGATVRLKISSDAMTTFSTPFDLTLPQFASMGSSLDGGLGSLTEDARTWAILFDLQVGTYFRLEVDAMGAGLLPTIGGLWVGLAHDVPRDFDMPWSEDMDRLNVLRTASEAGWLGLGNAVPQRVGQFGLRVDDAFRYDAHRLHYRSLYGMGMPSWVWFDRDQAERGMCILRPDGQFGFSYEQGWALRRRVTIPYQEHQPAVF